MKIQKQFICPSCNSKNVARFLYGIQEFSGKLIKEKEEGKIILAGCHISDDSPKYHCNDCGKEWGKLFEKKTSGK